MSGDEPRPEVMKVVDAIRSRLALEADVNTTALTYLLVELTLKAPKPNRERLAKLIGEQLLGKVKRGSL